jgi:hypothetical protein
VNGNKSQQPFEGEKREKKGGKGEEGKEKRTFMSCSRPPFCIICWAMPMLCEGRRRRREGGMEGEAEGRGRGSQLEYEKKRGGMTTNMAGLFIIEARSGIPPPIPGKPGLLKEEEQDQQRRRRGKKWEARTYIPPAPPAPAPLAGVSLRLTLPSSASGAGSLLLAVASELFIVALFGSNSRPFSYASTASSYSPMEKRAWPRRE